MNARRVFFYGTLMDPQVRRAVLRRSLNRSALHPAAMPGFRRVFRCGATYPVLIGDPAGSVDGIVASGLSRRDLARLIAYEGAVYRLSERPVQLAGGQTTQAFVFLPKTEAMASAVPWRFEHWRRRFRAGFLQGIGHHHRADRADRRAFRATAAAS